MATAIDVEVVFARNGMLAVSGLVSLFVSDQDLTMLNPKCY